jgi:hypothetical protein
VVVDSPPASIDNAMPPQQANMKKRRMPRITAIHTNGDFDRPSMLRVALPPYREMSSASARERKKCDHRPKPYGDHEMVMTKWTDIQGGILDESVVIDFEGFEDEDPSLCGVWMDEEFEPVVFDKELEPAALYTGQQRNRPVSYKNRDEFLD